MSARTLCAQRCTIIRLDMTTVDGAAIYDWVVVARKQPVRVDTFGGNGRSGENWSPEAGQPADRTGIAFFMPDAPARPGDRIVLTKGMTGNFTLGSRFNEALNRRGSIHHIEVQVTEVAKPLQVEVL